MDRRNLYALEVQARIAEIQRNIDRRDSQIDTLQTEMESRMDQQVEIVESEVTLKDRTAAILFTVRGGSDGVYALQSDIDSGAVTREQCYNELIDGLQAPATSSLQSK
jgi:hypothetical protein